MTLTREQVEHICKHGIEDGHLFTRIGAAHSILAHDAALRARIATYQARLEIDHEYNAAGERAEIPEAERDARIDGISCRDETIRLQDHAIDELKARIEALEQELVDNKIILTEERQINADNRRQIRGLQQREVELRHELEMKRQERDLAMNARDSFLQQLAAIRAELALFQGIFGEHDATPRAIDQARALWDGLTQQLAVQRDHLEEQQREYVKCAETIQLLKEQLATMTEERGDYKDQMDVGLQLTGSFFEALKPLKFTAIHVQDPGRHITDLIDQLRTAQATIMRLEGMAQMDKQAGEQAQARLDRLEGEP